MDINQVIWILIDFKYIDDPKDLSKLSQTCRYFYDRLKKSKHLDIKLSNVVRLGQKWKHSSNWNRFDFPPNFKIVKSYTEIISGNGAGLYSLPRSSNTRTALRMVASIFIKTPISNFFSPNPNGYQWTLGCGNRTADSQRFDVRFNKWKKLDFFKGGALFPVDLLIENCHLYCNSDPFSDIKIIWVHTNATLSDIKKYRFKWLNSKKEWKCVNKNRYIL